MKAVCFPKNVKTRWKWHNAQLVGCFKRVQQSQSNCIISSSGGKHQKNTKHYLKRQPSEESLQLPPFAPAHQSWSAKLLATDDICHTRWWLRCWPQYFAHVCHLTRKWPASKRPLFPGRSSKWDEWNDIYLYIYIIQTNYMNSWTI